MKLKFWVWAMVMAWKSGFRAGRMSKRWNVPKGASTTAPESSNL